MKKIMMLKIIMFITIIVVVLIALIYVLEKFSAIDFENPFKAKPITIDKTTNMVEEINQLAEFTTATYYQEMILKKVRKGIFFDDELVIIIKGKVRAWVDMSTLTKKDIVIDNDTIKIRLPKVKVLDVITNPSDFETYVESGIWSFDEVTKYKNEAREKLKKNALEDGILELAEKSAFERISSFFQALGFKKIIIE